MSKKVKRLFEGFKPENYDLEINLDKKNKSFTGIVKISGQKTGRPSSRITFHQKDLAFSKAKIIRYDKTGEQEIKVSRINTQNKLHELRLHSNSMLYPGKYDVEIEFSGKITDIMVGLYPCYFESDGKKDWLIASQFESHHAREAFPCIDEPEAKATFNLTLVTDDVDEVLSNTQVKEQTKLDKKRKKTTFETSPIMSSYLLAFVVGDIHHVESKTKDGIVVRSWASAAQPKNFLNFANEEAVKILEFYSEYFKTPFPLKKLDQVALPDFEVGAMENWGLITYREAAMLADPVNRSISTEQYVAMVVAHELSHQWFGNLVTMKWWDDLWLNESFASIVEHIALDNLHPDWHQWETFTSYDVIAASNRDNYLDVQPVSLDINHPDEIHTIFDGAIVYAKGARLLKMLFDYIGEDAMRTGLKKYFEKHAYKNTVRNDLWVELSEASGKDIDKLMTPWLIKSGMPVVSVKRSKDKLSLEQDRFLLNGEDKESIWPIPLLADRDLDIDIFDTRTIEIDYAENDEPVLNQNGSGHYIVNYSDKETKINIKQKLIKQEINSAGRINILNDMLLLTQNGQYPLADIIDIVDECDKEPRDAVWSMLGRSISFASMLSEGDKNCENQLNKLKVKLSQYWFEKLGWEDKEDDDPNTKLLRRSALGINISGENKSAIDQALSKFESAKSVEDLPAEHRSLIAGVAVRFSKDNGSLIKSLMNEYETSSNPDVQHSIASALCSTKDPEVAKNIVDWGLSKNGAVRAQDLTRWYVGLIRNRHIRDIAWKWLVSVWDERYEELGGPKTLPYFIRYSAGTITTDERANEFKKFFDSKQSDTGLARDIKVAYATIESQVAWRKREEPTLKKYLKKYS